LLDRAVLLRQIAEEYEQRTFDEQSRQAARKARRDALVAGPGATEEMGALMRALRPLGLRKAGATGYPALSGRRQSNGHARDDPLMTKVRAAEIAGQRVTGETVAEWLGVSPRTGRRRLAQLGNEADE